MEGGGLDWNLRRCLVWETERPFNERPRESPYFFLYGHECSLLLVVDHGSNRRYSVRIKSKNVYDSVQPCNITVYIKRRTGSIVLPKTSQLIKGGSSHELWSEYESSILANIRQFEYDGLLRFFILIDDTDVEKTFILKEDKSVQTEESLNQEKKEPIAQKNRSVQTPLYMKSAPCLENLSEDFSKYLKDESHYFDVELKCSGQTINAHKAILSARSQVLAKMLQNDMLEGRTGMIEVQDTDYEALVNFIRYLYSGTLPEFTVDTAKSLYEVADKYEVQGLMKRCANYLKENLTPENVCEVLSLADAHSDGEFKECVIAYILEEGVPLFDKQWEEFCEVQPKLATEVLNRFCKLRLSKAEKFSQ